jgi:surfeit locus 1 family protein
MRATLRSLLLPTVLTVLALAVLVSLGNWQVRRLAWKQDLIQRVRERPESPPLDLRSDGLDEIGGAGAFLDRNEYRPLVLSGTYSPQGEVLVFTSLSRPRGQFGGPGHWVLTPFVTPPSGAAVLVNRGFVPDGMEDAYSPPPEGEQTIEGLIRKPETGSWLTPDTKPEERLFYSRDPGKIAEVMNLAGEQNGFGYALFTTFFIDLDRSFTPPSGLPQAGETRIFFPNNHLQYAVTWYGLAAALLAVFSVFVWRRLKEPQSERLTPPGQLS